MSDMGETTQMMRRSALAADPNSKAPDKTMWQRALFWKLAMSKVLLLAGMAAGNSIVTSLSGSNWSDFTTSQKTVAWITASAAAATVIVAFLDSTMHDLKMTQQELKKIADETSTVASSPP